MNSQIKGAVQASFKTAKKIARACKLFTEEELKKKKKTIEKVSGDVCPDKKQDFANINLFRNTMATQVDELGSDLQIQLNVKLRTLVHIHWV